MIKIFYNSKLLSGDAVNVYLNIIKKSIEETGIDVKYIYGIKEIKKNDCIITTNVIDALKVLLCGKKVKLVNWYQGIIPEESYMRTNSILRMRIFEILEKITINRSKLNLFVSEYMKKHYEKKYGYNDKNYFIMPCFNANINKNAFFTENKYSTPTFLYAGGLSKWQCIDKMLAIYKRVEQECKNSHLEILTSEIEKANGLIKKFNIERFNIRYVELEKLVDEIKYFKYGFIIRDRCEVNYVATPTKMSTYLASGIIPIFSDAVGDFNDKFKNIDNKIHFGTNLNECDVAKKIIEFEKRDINSLEVFNEYSDMFDKYYCTDKYIEKLKTIFNMENMNQ